jgi:hypothetical protein
MPHEPSRRGADSVRTHEYRHIDEVVGSHSLQNPEHRLLCTGRLAARQANPLEIEFRFFNRLYDFKELFRIKVNPFGMRPIGAEPTPCIASVRHLYVNPHRWLGWFAWTPVLRTGVTSDQDFFSEELHTL